MTIGTSQKLKSKPTDLNWGGCPSYGLSVVCKVMGQARGDGPGWENPHRNTGVFSKSKGICFPNALIKPESQLSFSLFTPFVSVRATVSR